MAQCRVGIVHAGNERAPQYRWCACRVESPKILQYPITGDSDQRLMEFRRRLDIPEPQVHEGKQLFNLFPGGEAAGLHAGVYSGLTRCREQFASEVEVREGLPTGDGESAAGVVVEYLVRQDYLHDLWNRHRLSGDFQCADGAFFRASSAVLAPIAVDMVAVLPEYMAALWADSCASAALRAFLGIEEELRFKGVRLRVVAPSAAQRTALQEDHRADAGAVVDREFFDVENQRHQNFLR